MGTTFTHAELRTPQLIPRSPHPQSDIPTDPVMRDQDVIRGHAVYAAIRHSCRADRAPDCRPAPPQWPLMPRTAARGPCDRETVVRASCSLRHRARVAVCGLCVERGRIVFDQRLRPVGALQCVRIAVLELEDERPVEAIGSTPLTSTCVCPSPFGTIVKRGPLLFLEISVSTPLG
jgi:hypothetical protein